MSESSIQEVTEYLHEDKNLPIHSRELNVCTYSAAVKILLSSPCRICKKQPVYVQQNCTLVVDLNALEDPDDIKSDDCGHWEHNGRKSIKVAVWMKGNKC